MGDKGGLVFGWIMLAFSVAFIIAELIVGNGWGIVFAIFFGIIAIFLLYLFLYEPARDKAMKDPTTAAKFEKRKKGWIIAIVVVIIIALIGSCTGGGSSSNGGNLVTGKCSHCHGAGVTKYGKECAWCNGTGVYAFYD